MPRSHLKAECRSTLGKRKVTFLDGDSHKCDISINLNSQAKSHMSDWEITANCRIKDSDGREIGIKLNHGTLLALHAELGKMIEELKNNGGLCETKDLVLVTDT